MQEEVTRGAVTLIVDGASRDFQKCLIDTFVNAVYVFDDKLVLTYNYQHGAQTISLDEIESALNCGYQRHVSTTKSSQISCQSSGFEHLLDTAIHDHADHNSAKHTLQHGSKLSFCEIFNGFWIFNK